MWFRKWAFLFGQSSIVPWLPADNTYQKGMDHCTDGLQFNSIGFDQIGNKESNSIHLIRLKLKRVATLKQNRYLTKILPYVWL